MNHQLLNQIFMALDNDHNSTVYEVFLHTLRSQDTVHSRHRNSLITRIPDILDILSEQSTRELEVCASRVATTTYRSEIQSFIQPNSGFHFQGSTACLAQLERASILRTTWICHRHGHTPSFSSTSLWTSSSLLGIVSFKGFDRGILMGKSSRHWQEDNTNRHKGWVFIQIIQRKYMTMSEEFVPQPNRTKPPHQELPVIGENMWKLRFKIMWIQMWRQNHQIQHKMRALGFSIELCLLFFPTNGKESVLWTAIIVKWLTWCWWPFIIII